MAGRTASCPGPAQDSVGKHLEESFEPGEFMDVTLASENDKVIRATQVFLAAGGSFSWPGSTLVLQR